MRRIVFLLALLALNATAPAQVSDDETLSGAPMARLTQAKDYVLKRARITVTNEGREKVAAFYFNIDYRALSTPLAAGTLYFHAQYRQATPCKAIKGDGLNVEGQDNYVWMEATGRGHLSA